MFDKVLVESADRVLMAEEKAVAREKEKNGVKVIRNRLIAKVCGRRREGSRIPDDILPQRALLTFSSFMASIRAVLYAKGFSNTAGRIKATVLLFRLVCQRNVDVAIICGTSFYGGAFYSVGSVSVKNILRYVFCHKRLEAYNASIDKEGLRREGIGL